MPSGITKCKKADANIIKNNLKEMPAQKKQ
jgi:hypothetical protein